MLWSRITLSALFLALAVTLLVDIASLSPTARLVPLAVVIPAILLLLIQVCLDLFPGWAQTTGRYLHLHLRGVDGLKARSGAAKSDSGQPLGSVLMWFAGAPLSIYLFGFTLAAPLYTIVFLRFYARERWPRSLALGAAISALIMLLIVFAVREPLAHGRLIEWLAG